MLNSIPHQIPRILLPVFIMTVAFLSDVHAGVQEKISALIPQGTANIDNCIIDYKAEITGRFSLGPGPDYYNYSFEVFYVKEGSRQRRLVELASIDLTEDALKFALEKRKSELQREFSKLACESFDDNRRSTSAPGNNREAVRRAELPKSAAR